MNSHTFLVEVELPAGAQYGMFEQISDLIKKGLDGRRDITVKRIQIVPNVYTVYEKPNGVAVRA